jgi:pectate lyase
VINPSANVWCPLWFLVGCAAACGSGGGSANAEAGASGASATLPMYAQPGSMSAGSTGLSVPAGNGAVGAAGSGDEQLGPVALAPGGAGAAGASATPAVNEGMIEPPPIPAGDCNSPPAASPLVGWAAVTGNGVATTTGGGDAPPVTVTTLAQLQNAVLGTNPAVIFVKGVLAPGELRPGSNKTIVGICGAEFHGHMEITGATNVIIRNLAIVGFGPGNCSLDPGFDATVGCSSGDDAITVQRNAHHVWFDHCDISDGTDGNLDISNGANFVTISWTKFHYTARTDDVGDDSTGAAGHRYSNLVGGSDNTTADADALNVTWHHDWWADNVVERQPRVRFGENHLFNNYWASPATNYCVRAGIQAHILIENSYFDGVDSPHQFNNASDEQSASITVHGNVYDGTSGTQVTGGGGPAFTDPPYAYTLDDAAAVPELVRGGAGPK